MESNRELSLVEVSNVVSLDEQRKVRQQREEEQAEVQVESISGEQRCENGVCTLAWKPTRKAA